MWYDSWVPNELPFTALNTAAAAVAFAQQVRRYHRKRTPKTAKQREKDLTLAAFRLQEAMKPLRSAIGRFPYGAQTAEAEANRQAIREASAAIQRERRKIWKMQQKRKKR
jgi:hypothetical protein